MPEPATLTALTHTLGVVVVAAPVALAAVLGVSPLLGRPPTEEATGRSSQAAILVGFLAAVAVLGLMFLTGARHVTLDFGDWVTFHAAGQEHPYRFSVKFVFDRLSVPFVLLSFL